MPEAVLAGSDEDFVEATSFLASPAGDVVFDEEEHG